MTGKGWTGRYPFVAEIRARTCKCRQAPLNVGAFKTLDRALVEVGGYWSIYLAFFGDQQVWLEFTVTDLRDGALKWRDGHHIREEENGATQNGNGEPADGLLGVDRDHPQSRDDGAGQG